MTTFERRTTPSTVELRAEGEKRTAVGHAAVFGRFEAPPCGAAASGLQKIHSMIAGEEPRDTSTGR